MWQEKSIRNTPVSNAKNVNLLISTIIVLFLFENVVSDLDVVAARHIQTYCRKFRTCSECKSADIRCDWCHNYGCTSKPRRHCPSKILANSVRTHDGHHSACSQISSKSPIFVPANTRQNIRVYLFSDDTSVSRNKLFCEIRVDQKVIHTTAQLHNSTVYCDTVEIRILKHMSLGTLRVYWGGVVPYSNKILLVAYKCYELATSCAECSDVTKNMDGFSCGWCEETKYCSTVEQCPRQRGVWVTDWNNCDAVDPSSGSLSEYFFRVRKKGD